ncbi:MAG TPA: hypothetical protein PKA33_16055 [Amaricoccus sp.]|uniref:hypothetical protein n=1 Tax=Amaricoccus sp. TaxID=1872485 RepID=UPI002C8A9A8A|nr:hypothetical protein [Amaricoccus sp.]HMQ92484.1 hypothetical protein [Amaricoccus sp.]HMR53867.1 hypothetical protein [Amaricoccus sp.]HMR58984.1 hypothetical protein [Amaricoccus sp.]HMU00862.1 hypothetical protein [Amaricoccus sp.]
MSTLARYRRLTPKFPSEARQMERIRAGMHLLTNADLVEIRGDAGAEVAREIADTELQRRARLSAHERLAETAARARAAAC